MQFQRPRYKNFLWRRKIYIQYLFIIFKKNSYFDANKKLIERLTTQYLQLIVTI